MIKVIEIPVIDIYDKNRVRKEYGDIELLSNSIKDKGLLQPITICLNTDKMKSEKYQILAGSRRLRAVKELKYPNIGCIIRDTKDKIDQFEIEMLENTMRKDFTWWEECKMIYRLNSIMHDSKSKSDVVSKQWSKRKTAKLLGKDSATILRKIELYSWSIKIPEIIECKNELDAVKIIRKVTEGIAIKNLENKHEGAISKSKKKKKIVISDTDNEDDFIELCMRCFRIGDAFKGMQEIIDLDEKDKATIVFAEVDPPYGIGLKEKKQNPSDNIHDYNEIPEKDYKQFLDKLCGNLYDCLDENSHLIFWYGFPWYDAVVSTLKKKGFKVDFVPYIWVKGYGQTNQPDKYLARCYEAFIYAHKGNPVIQKRGRSNVFNFAGVPAQSKIHPTQRPSELMEEIYKTFVMPGEVCMIPFLGSGASLLAATKNKNLAFGWELSEEYKTSFLKLAADHYDSISYAIGK